VLAISVVVAGPFWGVLADRFGARIVASASLVAYGFALALLPFGVRDIYTFCTAYLIISSLGVGATPVTLLKPIADTFQANRGLALGVVITGFGLSAFWVPRLVTYLIQKGDWQYGYRGLAVIAILAAPIVWFCLPSRVAPDSVGPKADDADVEGLTLKEARATFRFWLLIVITCAMALGLAGIIIHLLPMFVDMGATPSDAAATTSLLGFSSVAGRLGIGIALDRLRGPIVAFGVMAIGSIGAALLHIFGLSAGAVAVLFIGFAFGAEIDIIAYLTSRYLGRRSYSAIYGWMYAMVAIGSGLSSYMIGTARDHYGNYDAALVLSIILTMSAGLLALLLGPYRYGVR
jgi:predicted MFS family arabinose efflux permease